MAEKDEKTEQPTGKRKQEARSKGQVAKSQDLGSAILLLLGAILLWSLSSFIGSNMQGMMREVFGSISQVEITPNNFVYYARSGAKFIVLLLGPLLVTIAFVGVAVNVLQVGFLFATQSLKPDFFKMFSPKAFMKLVSKDKFVELLKNMAKMSVIGVIVFSVIKSHYRDLLLLADHPLADIIATLISILIEMVIKTSILLVILGIVDLFYQRWKTNEEMKMSKQEVKDEAKMSDGDPKIKAKLKQMRIQMHQKFMMQEVPQATVVVTNPTFIAIAIRYESGMDQTPVVVAKGKRLIAERIRDLARENDVPIVENKPLARGLYDIIEVGDTIPEEFFAPVAEILAYVYKMQNKRSHEMA